MGISTNVSKRGIVTILRILYPVWTLIAIPSLMYVAAAVVVPGDAASTASNMMTNQLLFNLSIVGSLVTQLIHIFMVLLFWELFKSVDRQQAGLILVLGLVSVPMAMFNSINLIAAQVAVSSVDALSGLTSAQSQSLMMFFINLNDKGILLAQIFWGLWLFPIAILIYKSGYFAKITGHFLIIAGFGYLFASLGTILVPHAGSSLLFTAFNIMSFGEILFMLWIVIGGARLPEEVN